MEKVKYLSYILQRRIPVYGNETADMGIKPKKNLNNGDSCNTYMFSMENHWGTHIDAPAHFFSYGLTISDYPAEHWIFKHPCVVNISPDTEMVIKLSDIEGKVNHECDLLLLKTGFGKYRGTRAYSFNGPAVSPEVGLWLRAQKPRLRAIGLDFVSIGSYSKKDMGRAAHRAFLDPEAKGDPVLIIEDMDLNSDMQGLKTVYVVPLVVENIDSAPCTAIGIF
jgi:kynurenine formamidase